MTGCGGTLSEPTGTLTSPGHPNIYPHGVNCSWTIQASPGLVVRLTFHTFSIESNANCRYDYVELYDNYTASSNSLLGRSVSLWRLEVMVFLLQTFPLGY